MVKKWSFEEQKYLSENWGQVELRVIMEVLDRSYDSVVRKAQRLELDSNKYPKENLTNRWSEQEENVLYSFYQVKPMNELILLLPNRTRESIIKKAKQLGLNCENRHWLTEEVTYLEEKWGVMTIENIAKKLARTKNAVLLKAHKIGLREQIIANGEYLTPKDISNILAVGTRTVYNWMDKNYLNYKKFRINSIKKYQISIDNFKLFIEEHEDKWNTRTADIKFITSCYTTFRDIASTKVPEWLQQKINVDKHKKPRGCRKQWTIKEENRVKSMINGGKTCKEIALLLNRSFYSVQDKISSKRHEYFQSNNITSSSLKEMDQVSIVG